MRIHFDVKLNREIKHGGDVRGQDKQWRPPDHTGQWVVRRGERPH